MIADQGPSSRPAAIEAWVSADRRTDLDTMQAQLANNVVLVSPLTDAFTFHGPHDVTQVFASAFDLLTDIEIHKLTGAGSDWVLYGINKLKKANLEEVQWLHLDDDGLIDHITLFIRPAPAAISLFARIGRRMHKRGLMPRRSAVGSTALAPIAALLRFIERRAMPSMGPHKSST